MIMLFGVYNDRKYGGKCRKKIGDEMMINKEPNQVQSLVEYLHIPWAIDISDDGRIYFTERDGNLRVITYGNLNPVPIHTFGLPFISTGEGGLLGLALDRDFLSNGYIYIMYTYGEKGKLYNRVVRMRVVGEMAFKEGILLDRIPGGRFHNGGRIKIGPDGYLYIATGDGGIHDLSQDVNSLAGKILRIGTDGSIPPDNPFQGSPVYAMGLRNPEGLAWNDKNMLYVTDHGDTNHDEINLILPGGNYGSPLVIGSEKLESDDFIQPILESGDTTWAPGGAAFINSGPRKGQLLVSMLRGNGLLAITFDETGTQVVDVEPLLLDTYGRLREVHQASDGSIYITTSNKDGRGNIHFGDDKILKIAPSILI